MKWLHKTKLLFIAISATLSAHAQEYYIKGHVTSEKVAVEYANIVLQKTDSSFVTGCVADQAGHFRMNNVQPGNYRICLSSIGYTNRIIQLPSLSRNTDLGDIKMDSASIALNEVVIKGSHVINGFEKKIVLPSAYQIKASTNAIELLWQMHLNQLTVDPVRNSITSSNQGEVQLRINGVKAEIQQIKALRPEDIIRVEYHDNPSMRYGENVAAVIDYITKRAISGGYIAANLENSPFTGFGEDELTFKFNRQKSEFGMDIYGSYRNLKGYWRKNSETFNFENGTSFTRKEEGTPSTFIEDHAPLSFYYNYQEGEKWFFNATLNAFYYNQKIDTRSLLFPETDRNNSVSMVDCTKNSSMTPSLDLYFQRNYKNRQHLILDIVGTYIDTRNRRNYTETKDETIATDIYSKINGKKYSLIAEAIYEKGINASQSICIGTRYSQSYTGNQYLGTINTNTNMHEGRSASFIEYKGQSKQLNYSLGSYLSYFWTQQDNNTYHKFIFYPKAKLGYTFSDKASIRLSSELYYNTPSLSDLSNVEQIIDSLQIRRGNPNLKVSHAWSNSLYAQWHNGLLSSGINLFYMYQGNPIMEETLRENNKFIRTTLNQQNWQKVNSEINLQFGPIKDIVNFNFTGGMSYFDSKGTDYHHTYTNWYYRAGASVVYKNFTSSFEIYSHQNDFYGETLTYGENIHMLSLKYKHKDMSFGITTFNPFAGRNSYNRPTKNWNKYAPSYNTWYLRESSRLVVATFSWNISFGRKYKAAEKQLNNSDNDAGTIKNTK